jgi:hypothetical protein
MQKGTELELAPDIKSTTISETTMTTIDYLNYEIFHEEGEPFSVKKPSGNLLGHYATYLKAKEAIKAARIEDLEKEIEDIKALDSTVPPKST